MWVEDLSGRLCLVILAGLWGVFSRRHPLPNSPVHLQDLPVAWLTSVLEVSPRVAIPRRPIRVWTPVPLTAGVGQEDGQGG